MPDASLLNGRSFIVGNRRASGFLGLFDQPPPRIGESVQLRHIEARRRWPKHRLGIQVGWSMHGNVHILRFEDGNEIAVWSEEVAIN